MIFVHWLSIHYISWIVRFLQIWHFEWTKTHQMLQKWTQTETRLTSKARSHQQWTGEVSQGNKLSLIKSSSIKPISLSFDCTESQRIKNGGSCCSLAFFSAQTAHVNKLMFLFNKKCEAESFFLSSVTLYWIKSWKQNVRIV